MKFLPFVLNHMRHTWVRTGSTVVAMGLAVLLFCTLQTALARFNRVIDTRCPRRLVTRNAVSFMIPLPVSYGEPILKAPGVRRVAIMNPFGGILPARKEGKDDGGSSSIAGAVREG